MMGLQKMPQKHWRPRPCDIGGASKWSPGMMNFPVLNDELYLEPQNPRNHRVDLPPTKPKPKKDLPTTLFWGGKDPGENGGKTGEQFVRQSAGTDTRYFDQARENTIKDASLDIVTRFWPVIIMAGQPTPS